MTTLTVYNTGGPAVSGDQLNTFVQNGINVATLRSFTGITGIAVYVLGTSTPNDGGQGFFYWNSTGVAADDNGATTVVPNGAGSGEWTRISTATITNLSLGGSLTVAGATTLNSSLTANGAVVINSTISGFMTLFNNQTGTSYTVQSTDSGVTVTFNSASAVTVTLPATLSVGFTCECINLGAGKVTFSAASGATLQNRSSQYSIAGQYGAVRLTIVTNAGGSAAVYNLAGDTSS